MTLCWLLVCAGFATRSWAADQNDPGPTPAAPPPVAVENPNQTPPADQAPHSFDVRALSIATRPAVALIAVADKNGKITKTGTGFFLSADGKLVTNAHVVEGGTTATAKLENGATYAVQGVIKAATDKDLVLLKADAKDVPFLTVGPHGLPDVGSRVAVIGSPLGLEGSVSEGIVSGQRALKKDDQWLQITAAVSPGSSGSPVVDEEGKVVGVATFVIDRAQSLNFARPIAYVSTLMDQSGEAEPAPLWTIAEDPKRVLLNDPEFVEADKALRKGEPAAALKILNEIAPRYLENASLLFEFGLVYDQLNLLEDAVKSFQGALKLEPTNGMAWTSLGSTFAKLRRLPDAKEAARQAVKVAPDLGAAWALLGNIYAEQGQTEDAIDALKKAVRYTPNDSETWRALSAAYAKRKDDAGMKTADAKIDALTNPNPVAGAVTAAGEPAPARATLSHDKYADVVMSSLRGFEHADIKGLLAKYDKRVAYRDYGIVDRDFIRQDLQKYFQRWPLANLTLLGPIEVLDSKKPEEKVVRFRYEFRAASPDRKTFSVGTAWTVWSVLQGAEGIKVWGETQRVVRRTGH